MSPRPRILCVADKSHPPAEVTDQLRGTCEVVQVHSAVRALASLARNGYDGLYVTAEHLQEALRLGRLLQNERILDGLPDGVALLDADNMILWANARFHQWCRKHDVHGTGFYPAGDFGSRLLSVSYGFGYGSSQRFHVAVRRPLLPDARLAGG